MTVRSILFLCVANSARSQMAEGLARSLLGPNVVDARLTDDEHAQQPANLEPTTLA